MTKKARRMEGQAVVMVAQFDDLEMDNIPMVKLGDASIATPFTSNIIRQVRCALVTSM